MKTRTAIAISLTAITGCVAVGSPALQADRRTKEACTVKGTLGPDVLRGSARRDVICALGGDDTVYGARGGDRILGGAGDDELYGEAGNDSVLGGEGADQIDGGLGQNLCSDSSEPGRACVDSIVVRKLRVSPGRVNTSSEPRDVRVTLELVDTQPVPAEIGHVSASLASPRAVGGSGGALRLVEATDARSRWTGTVEMSRDAPRGFYSVALEAHELPRDGELPNIHLFRVPKHAAASSGVEQVGKGDEGAPRVTAVRVRPKVIDTTTGPATVKIDVDARDDREIRTIFAELDAPPGSAFDEIRYLPIGADSHGLVDGSASNGTWRRTITFPAGTPRGRIAIEAIEVADDFSQRTVDGTALAKVADNPAFKQVGTPDSGLPELTGFSLSRTEFGYGQPPDAEARITAIDDFSGVKRVSVDFARPGERRTGGGGLSGSVPLARSVDWKFSAYLVNVGTFGPPEPGVRKISVTVWDGAGNSRTYSSAELAAQGWPSEVEFDGEGRERARPR